MRRSTLTLSCVVVAVAGTLAWTTAPGAGPASAAAAVVGATTIQHVVVIYQENHSFDETLGALCMTRPTPCDGFVGTVTLKGGTRVAMRPSPDVVPQVVHIVASQQAAVDGGAMDGWARVAGCDAAHSYVCLTYYSPAQIPTLARLANAYAVSDRTFSMANSPSWGGHLYAAAASNDGFTGDNPRAAPGVATGPGWGCDSNMTSAWRSPTTHVVSQQPACIPDSVRVDARLHPNGGAFRATPVGHVDTIFDRLDAAALPWRIYGQADPTDTSKRNGYIWSICPSFAGCLYTRQATNLVPTAQVLTDAAAGTLPAYSVLTPSASSRVANGGVSTSQHNGDSMLGGDNWIAKTVSAIQGGPNGPSTAIFITYDDCGCFYDHVPPGVNPDGTTQGPREPMVIVSPYTKPGFTDSTPATFASILAFTEHTFGLAPLSTNDAAAYDYANSFDFTAPPRRPVPLGPHPVPASTVGFLRNHPVDDDDVT